MCISIWKEKMFSLGTVKLILTFADVISDINRSLENAVTQFTRSNVPFIVIFFFHSAGFLVRDYEAITGSQGLLISFVILKKLKISSSTFILIKGLCKASSQKCKGRLESNLE